jgi:hypothetical protein
VQQVCLCYLCLCYHNLKGSVDGTPGYQDIKLPLPPLVVQGYLHTTSIKHGPDGQPLDPRQYNSFSHVNAAKSTVIFLYKEHKRPLEVDLTDTMMDIYAIKSHFSTKACELDYVCGYKRKVAQLKEDGIMKMTEGKDPVSKEGITCICWQYLVPNCW